jgi:cytidylate kinase
VTIIAISRGTMIGGEALATSVADRLGYRCLSREVLLEAAWGYGIPVNELDAAMEKPPPLWERLIGKRTAYLTFVRAALCDQAMAGRLVYHGYVGHLVFPGVSHVLRVRAIADLDYRIEAAMRHRGLTRKDAVAFIERVDKERRQWTRSAFDVEWDDPALYDVVVNLSRMRLETATELVVRLTEREEFQPTAASRKALRDLALGNRVAATLARDARTQAATLEVTADDGRVTVTGTTQSSTLSQAVGTVAREVDGVADVRSEVRLLREGKGPLA